MNICQRPARRAARRTQMKLDRGPHQQMRRRRVGGTAVHVTGRAAAQGCAEPRAHAEAAGKSDSATAAAPEARLAGLSKRRGRIYQMSINSKVRIPLIRRTDIGPCTLC